MLPCYLGTLVRWYIGTFVRWHHPSPRRLYNLVHRPCSSVGRALDFKSLSPWIKSRDMPRHRRLGRTSPEVEWFESLQGQCMLDSRCSPAAAPISVIWHVESAAHFMASQDVPSSRGGSAGAKAPRKAPSAGRAGTGSTCCTGRRGPACRSGLQGEPGAHRLDVRPSGLPPRPWVPPLPRGTAQILVHFHRRPPICAGNGAARP